MEVEESGLCLFLQSRETGEGSQRTCTCTGAHTHTHTKTQTKTGRATADYALQRP